MAADQDVVAQFQKEIDFMQRTRHPHIVRFFGAGSFPSGAPFLVEELMDKSLQAYVQTTPDVPWAVKYKLLGDVSEGMQHIHNLGHMHRDLKTANVLINSRLQAKVADFGSMRELLLGGPVASATAGHRGADNAGAMSTNVGTPLYMSLEVLLGQPYDKAADTWSFGVVMWEVRCRGRTATEPAAPTSACSPTGGTQPDDTLAAHQQSALTSRCCSRWRASRTRTFWHKKCLTATMGRPAPGSAKCSRKANAYSWTKPGRRSCKSS